MTNEELATTIQKGRADLISAMAFHDLGPCHLMFPPVAAVIGIVQQ